MVLKGIQCAGREFLWEHSAFFTGKGCGFHCESRQSSLPVQSCFWEASPRYLNSFLKKKKQFPMSRVSAPQKRDQHTSEPALLTLPPCSTPNTQQPRWWHLPAVPRAPPVLCSKPGHTPCSIPGVLGAGSSSSGVRTAGVNISVLHVLVVGQDFHKTPRLHPWVYT